ncbi:membrane hypothetical protein [Candidatus Sulfopaludibacter sp. SbA6]|nr:membrane hypothetical protein [Candidatus Sulfopaludibacter sp. SbA6]
MAHVRWLGVAVICVYILGLTGVGLRFSRHQTSTERYFTAKRSVPFWAVGMSFLTATSVTFIAFPGAAYAKDWSLFQNGAGLYLLALTINRMTGWNMDQVILISGLLTMIYTLKGGFEAVVSSTCWRNQSRMSWSSRIVTRIFSGAPLKTAPRLPLLKSYSFFHSPLVLPALPRSRRPR